MVELYFRGETEVLEETPILNAALRTTDLTCTGLGSNWNLRGDF
jgi:hypothetical protein